MMDALLSQRVALNRLTDSVLRRDGTMGAGGTWEAR